MEDVVWKFELDVIKEYLSKFYGSELACIREYVANAIAAQHAVGVRTPIYVEITPERIVVEDNGIGISKEKFKNVFLWFGRSENKNLEGVQGKFGLGAKSFIMLTGDEGKMIMKTRSRETGEAYSAILTSKGAKILEDGGKETYGTRFEIYPKKELTKDEVEEHLEYVVKHFEFSRIPVRVVVKSKEELKTILGKGKDFDVVIDGSLNCRPLRFNEVYELSKIDEDSLTIKNISYWWSDYRRLVVYVGDVMVTYVTIKHDYDLLLRIKVEDGREVELVDDILKARAPEPLPNRDTYKNVEAFAKAVLLVNVAEHVRNAVMSIKSINDLIGLGYQKAKRLYRCINELAEYYQRNYNVENPISYLNERLEGLKDVYEWLILLLSELPLYGVGADVSSGKRSKVLVIHFVREHLESLRNGGSSYKYLTKAISKVQERALIEKDVSAILLDVTKLDCPAIVRDKGLKYCCVEPTVKDSIVSPSKILDEIKKILEKYGVKAVSRDDLRAKAKVKLYYENRSYEVVDDSLVTSYWRPYKLIVVTDKITQLNNLVFNTSLARSILPIVCKKSSAGKIKESLGDFVMFYKDFLEHLKKFTLVTDGYEVYTLPELEKTSENHCSLVYLRNLNELKLIPLLRRLGLNVYGLITMGDVWGERTLDSFLAYYDEDYRASRGVHEDDVVALRNWLKCQTPEENASVEILAILTSGVVNYAYDDLLNLVYEKLDVRVPTVEAIVEKVRVKYAELAEEGLLDLKLNKLDEVIEGGKWLHPLFIKGLQDLSELLRYPLEDVARGCRKLERALAAYSLYNTAGFKVALLAYNNELEPLREFLDALSKEDVKKLLTLIDDEDFKFEVLLEVV